MKKLILFALLVGAPLFAQSTKLAPDCTITFTFTGSGQSTANNTCGQQGTNSPGGILEWTLVYFVNGFSGVTIAIQSAPDANGTPGSWGTFSGTVNTGSNPSTATPQSFVQVTGFNPWNRVSLTAATGSGNVQGQLYGCRQPGCSSSASASAAAFYQTMQNAGSALPQEPIMNFTGAGVTCADDAAHTRSTCTISGGSGIPVQVNGAPVATATTINFAAGTNTTVTATNSGGTVTVTYNASGGGGGGVSYKYNYYVAGVNTGNTAVWNNNGSIVSLNNYPLPVAVGGTLNGVGLIQMLTGGGASPSNMIVTHIPSTWDGSAILFNVDALASGTGGSGNATLTPYSACFSSGQDTFIPTWTTGSSVSVAVGAGTLPLLFFALTIPSAACAADDVLFVLVNRPSDTFGNNVNLIGGNLGIKY